MVRDFKKAAYRLLPLGLLGMIAACNGDTGDDEVEGCQYRDPAAGADCSSCQMDGECCEYSINCQAGSICNIEGDPLFDPTKTAGTCVKVVCTNDSDCDAPKTCSLEKLCKPPICQNDAECAGGQKCLNGTCQQGPNVDDVTACEVVSRSTALRQGATLELAAVAKNANGAVLPGIPFTWTSANPNVVSIDGNIATGGTEQGTTQITAAVMGKAVTCDGSVSITNFPTVPQDMVRVVLVADDDGSPVTQADVYVEAGGSYSMQTDGTGSVTVGPVGGAVESVTVMKDGWQIVSVLQPGTNDVFIPLPRVPDDSVAGGFRGKVDLSATRKADIRLGIAGPAIPSNLLDFGLDALIGDSVPTVIDAPELGLDMEQVDLPGGVMLGLGTKNFTQDPTRCQGTTVGPNELGCYLARAPKGPAAGWVLAGQLKLSDVTSIANELSNALGGGDDINIGSILTAVLPLVRSLNHGIVASLDIQEYPKMNGQADYSKYVQADIAASQSLGVLAKVSVPNLPELPGGGCAAGAILLSGVNLEGRGLVPLGLTAGVDTLEDTETPDCKIAGVDKPFGDNSPALPDGVMPLSMAPPHSGVEGSQIFLLLVALDPNSIGGDAGFQISALVNRVDNVDQDHAMSGTYLPFPTGTVSRSNFSVTLDRAVTGAALVRVELQRGDDTWLVYAPGTATSIQLPTVAEAREIVANLSNSYLLGMGMEGSYADVWTFGSGKTLNRMFYTATSFVVQQCARDAASPCTIE